MKSTVERPVHYTESYGDFMCCIPRQNCNNRDSWVSVADSSVKVLEFYGLYVPLGNSNFHLEKYRACQFIDPQLSTAAYLSSDNKYYCP